MNTSQRLSMVVCSFNQAAYLRQNLRSLTEQKDLKPGELEILVIDGGSTDGSVEIIKEFAPKLDYWVSERDRGQSHALSKGFARATGQIQGWLCSDDVLEPTAVREVLDYFASHPAARFVYGNYFLIDPQDRKLKLKKEIPFNWFIWRHDFNYIPQPSAFWRSDLYREVGGLDESLQVAMDGDLWARFAAHTKPRHITQTLSCFRLQPEQKTQLRKAEHQQEHENSCLRVGKRPVSPAARGAAHVLAKGWRVGWKLLDGCYW